MIRLNAEYVAILKANSKRDLQMIVKDFNIPGVNESTILTLYNRATANKGQMLFVDSVQSQLRFNFNKVIQLSEDRLNQLGFERPQQ